MSSIVENQQRAFIAQATDAAKRLADTLRNVSPAEQAAILATVAAAVSCPIDITLTTGEYDDVIDAARLLDGVLAREQWEMWTWKVGSGCEFAIDLTSRKDVPHE